MSSQPAIPQYLRVARSLALIGALSAAGCAGVVAPPDPDASGSDVAVADGNVTDGSVGDGSSCAHPGPENAACSTAVQCTSGCGAWACQIPPGSNTGSWHQLLCAGPLAPPESPDASART